MARGTVSSADIKRAIRAARAAGAERFDVAFDDRGRPVIRVLPGESDQSDIDAELERWDREALS